MALRGPKHPEIDRDGDERRASTQIATLIGIRPGRSFAALCIFAVALCPFSMAAQDHAVSSTLDAVVVHSHASTTTSALSFSEGRIPRESAHFYLKAPPRYVVDLEDTRADANLRTIVQGDDPLVAGIRYGQHGSRLRVVFDLKIPLESSGNALAKTDTGLRLAWNRTGPSDAGAPEQNVATVEQSLNVNAQADTTPVAALESTSPTPANNKASPPQPRPRTIVFGANPATAQNGPTTARDSTGREPATELGEAPTPLSDWIWSLDRGLAEAGYIDADDGAGANLHLQTIGSIEGPLSDRLRIRLSARADGQYQYGDLPSLERTRTDYDESWLRFDDGSWRVTAGAQRIIWGMSDDFSPTDRLSTRDFTRLLMDDLADRRRANPALRVEWRDATQRVDLVYLPVFREAELPGQDSVWFPVNRTTGAVAGLPLDDEASGALVGADIINDIDGDAGIGLRYMRTGSRWDISVTAQRVHNPEPYFTLTRPPADGTPAQISAVYPRTNVIGGGLATAIGAWTLRGEAAWLSDSPYTRATDFSLQTTEELNWVLGAEVFPGDGDLRVTTQLSGRHLLNTTAALDFVDVLSLFGEAELPFIAGGLPWRARVRYSWRLDEDGSYFNPELSYTGWEPSEIYIGVHLYDGAYGTAEEFYSNRDMAVIGWRARL